MNNGGPPVWEASLFQYAQKAASYDGCNLVGAYYDEIGAADSGT